jgi:xanthine dehydrogenase accessory factor
MTERFVQNLIERLEAGAQGVLCQVVETRGSTPQKAGAAMFLDMRSGEQLGTLGGGCVEAEVRQRAFECLGPPEVATLHTFTLDHDQAWADGLICGGRMAVLSQAVSGGAGGVAYVKALREAIRSGDGLTEVVVMEGGELNRGARWLFGPGGERLAGMGGASDMAPEWVREAVEPAGARRRARVVRGVAVLPSPPRVRLVIVGAGHVGQAVAELASRADFAVWIVDDRSSCASRERFPDAERRIVGPIGPTLDGIAFGPSTYALIVTRGHGHDQEALQHVAPTRAGYVGLIGSRRKIRLIFDALLDVGVRPEDLARVAAPVGLEIGSESVPEIAVSIVAELIARRNRGPSAVEPRGWIAPAEATVESRGELLP